MSTTDASSQSLVGRGTLRFTNVAIELFLLVLVLVGLSWQFRAFNGSESGANSRYDTPSDLSVAVPVPAGGRDHWKLVIADKNLQEIPAAWKAEFRALANAIAAPMKEVATEIRDIRLLASEGQEADASGALAEIQARSDPYISQYGVVLEGNDARVPPLDCAEAYLGALTQVPPTSPTAEGDLRERAVALYGQLLDGATIRAPYKGRNQPATGAVALPPWQTALSKATADTVRGCSALGEPSAVIASATRIVGLARDSGGIAAKATGMRELLTRGDLYFAAYAMVGWLLLQVGRWRISALRFMGFAAIAWAVTGWATHVYGVSSRYWMDAGVVGMLMIVLSAALRRIRSAPMPNILQQTMSSRLGYAGFVLLTGIGFWVQLDLAAFNHPKNQYLAVYQWQYVFAAFVVVSTTPTFVRALAPWANRAAAKWAMVRIALEKERGAIRWLPLVSQVIWLAMLIGLMALALRNKRQMTSELLRVWLLLGVSWFFFFRGEGLLRMLAAASGGATSVRQYVKMVLYYAWPGLFVFLAAGFALFATDDMGPVLVIAYALGIYVSAGVAFAVQAMTGKRAVGDSVGVLACVVWVAATTWALFMFGGLHTTTAARIASARSPMTAPNDQMAIIHFFVETIPRWGYGLTDVPWCGDLGGGTCRGIPRQVQSDYMFTAIQGVFGQTVAVGLVLFFVFWLIRLVRRHPQVTSGAMDVRVSSLHSAQGWLSWLAVCWVGFCLAQAAITIAGNLGILPLTGITFPFVSYGVWSLLANAFFLGVAINLPARQT